MSAPRKFDAETRARAVQERQREAALDEAARDLAAARRQLDDAVEHARSKGRHYAGRIKDAIDDDVKDSWWDNVKDWVDRNAGWIKAVTTALSIVATALAVLVLFIPGWNLLAIGLLVGVVVGLSQGLLAASGNGSWADVGLTVFSLATLGLGRLGKPGSRQRPCQLPTWGLGRCAARRRRGGAGRGRVGPAGPGRCAAPGHRSNHPAKLADTASGVVEAFEGLDEEFAAALRGQQ